MADQEENVRIYERMREELAKRQIVNSQIYDTSILTFSMGTLALLSNLLKDVHFTCCSLLLLGITSIVLLVAVFSTLTSFIVGQKAIKAQLEIAKKYYLEGNAEAEKKTNPYTPWIAFLNYASGIAFMLGIISALTLLFAIFCKN